MQHSSDIGDRLAWVSARFEQCGGYHGHAVSAPVGRVPDGHDCHVYEIVAQLAFQPLASA